METALTIIGIVSGIVSLYFLIYNPMNKNSIALKESAMMTEENTNALNSFRKEVKEELQEIKVSQKESIAEINKKKHESHEKLWKHNEMQDEKIEDHSVRIKIIEREVGINGKQN